MLEFIQKIQTPKLIEVTIKKVYEEKTSTYEGKTKSFKNCIVDYNGKEYYAKFNPKQYPIATEGNKVSGVREVINGHPYFQWMSGGDGLTPIAGPGVSEPVPDVEIPDWMQQSQEYNEPKKASPNADPFQDKMSRGASWNNAFAYCLEHKVGEESFIDFLGRVAETAEEIAPYQSKFVNGNT